MGSSLGSSSSLTDKLEASLIIDILTIGILGYLSYFLYIEMDMRLQDEIFSVPADPHVLAFQLSVFLILIYTIEALHDRIKGGGSSPYG